MAPGIWQILLIVLVILLLFGAGKLPRVMEDVAKGIKGFKKGLKDEEDERVIAHKDDNVIDAEVEKPAEKEKQAEEKSE